MPEVGQTALVLLVGAADPWVARWREVYDPAATQGMPAHLTVLYPFLDVRSLTAEVLALLGDVVGERPPFALTFAAVARFPGSLWLAPEPAAPVRELIESVCRTWPSVQPYGGELTVEEVVPHLTVAVGSPQRWDEITADLQTGLPWVARIDAAHLFLFDGGTWVVRHTFALGGSAR